MADLTQLNGVEPDGFLTINSRDAMNCTRRLAREEGIFAGPSSRANLAAAISLLEGPMPGATVAILACDSGLKYLSTDIWNR
jgi:cysteine synthase A